MIWAVIVGFLLASGGAPVGVAVPMILILVALKGAAEIAFEKSPITGAESPYVTYVQNLEASGTAPANPWLGYMMQVVVFGSVIGMGVYGLWQLLT